ncbi:MAG: hypothetical protein ACYDH3_12155, partial [Candidatus Aminicenantales bacterium]
GRPYSFHYFSRGQLALGGGILLGVVGAAIGGIFTALDRRHSYTLKEKSSEEIKATVIKLRKLARDRG